MLNFRSILILWININCGNSPLRVYCIIIFPFSLHQSYNISSLYTLSLLLTLILTFIPILTLTVTLNLPIIPDNFLSLSRAVALSLTSTPIPSHSINLFHSLCIALPLSHSHFHHLSRSFTLYRTHYLTHCTTYIVSFSPYCKSLVWRCYLLHSLINSYHTHSRRILYVYI